MTHKLAGLRRAAAGFAAILVGMFAAGATMGAEPGGTTTQAQADQEFSDANGSLDLQRPEANATCAAAYAELSAVDLDATKEKAGTVFDNKEHIGVIDEAVIPVWIWQLHAGKRVSTFGYRSGSFSDDEDLTGWGRAELIYEGPSGDLYLGCEVKTTNQSGAGMYDIEVTDFENQDHTITDGGQSWTPAWTGSDIGGGGKEISIDQQFAWDQLTVTFKYESRAKCSVKLGFDEEDNGVSTINVDVMHHTQVAGPDEWEGAAYAWDMNPYYGPSLLGAFVLDPLPQ